MTVRELRDEAERERYDACRTMEIVGGISFPTSECLVDDIIRAAVLTMKADLLEEQQSDDYGIGSAK